MAVRVCCLRRLCLVCVLLVTVLMTTLWSTGSVGGFRGLCACMCACVSMYVCARILVRVHMIVHACILFSMPAYQCDHDQVLIVCGMHTDSVHMSAKPLWGSGTEVLAPPGLNFFCKTFWFCGETPVGISNSLAFPGHAAHYFPASLPSRLAVSQTPSCDPDLLWKKQTCPLTCTHPNTDSAHATNLHAPQHRLSTCQHPECTSFTTQHTPLTCMYRSRDSFALPPPFCANSRSTLGYVLMRSTSVCAHVRGTQCMQRMCAAKAEHEGSSSSTQAPACSHHMYSLGSAQRRHKTAHERLCLDRPTTCAANTRHAWQKAESMEAAVPAQTHHMCSKHNACVRQKAESMEAAVPVPMLALLPQLMLKCVPVPGPGPVALAMPHLLQLLCPSALQAAAHCCPSATQRAPACGATVVQKLHAEPQWCRSGMWHHSGAEVACGTTVVQKWHVAPQWCRSGMWRHSGAEVACGATAVQKSQQATAPPKTEQDTHIHAFTRACAPAGHPCARTAASTGADKRAPTDAASELRGLWPASMGRRCHSRVGHVCLCFLGLCCTQQLGRAARWVRKH